MNANDSSQVLQLIQKKMQEKDEVIREQMEQIVALEEELMKVRTERDGLAQKLSGLESMREEYLALKSQLQQLLG